MSKVVYFWNVSDLALHRREDGCFDLAFSEADHDLLTTDGLENVVVISIGTYARERRLSKVANLAPVVGGWWGDALDEKGTLGGYLYEAFPGKLTNDTARRVEGLVVEALAWMVKDGVAKSAKCLAEIVDDETMSVKITIERPDGENEALTYEIKWKATDGI